MSTLDFQERMDETRNGIYHFSRHKVEGGGYFALWLILFLMAAFVLGYFVNDAQQTTEGLIFLGILVGIIPMALFIFNKNRDQSDISLAERNGEYTRKNFALWSHEFSEYLVAKGYPKQFTDDVLVVLKQTPFEKYFKDNYNNRKTANRMGDVANYTNNRMCRVLEPLETGIVSHKDAFKDVQYESIIAEIMPLYEGSNVSLVRVNIFSSLFMSEAERRELSNALFTKTKGYLQQVNIPYGR